MHTFGLIFSVVFAQRRL